MNILHSLKFSYNRSKTLSAILLHFRQITLLGVIAASEDINLFKNIFEIFIFKDTQTPYFLLAGLIFNCLVAIIFLLLWALKVEKLKVLLCPLSIFIKLYPYLFSIISFYYCLYAIFHSQDILIRLLGVANIPFLLSYLFLHQFINQSLKFREVDSCNQKINSISGVALIPLALTIMHLTSSPFFGFVCCAVRAASELLNLLSRCEFVHLQRIKSFYALFTFYLTFIHFLLYFNLFIDSSNIYSPVVKIGLIAAGVIASWVLSQQTVSIIWNKMLRFCKSSGQRSEGQNYDSDLPTIIKIQNELNILVQAFIQRQRYLNNLQNNYNSFWRDFNQIVFSHKLRCDQPRCICQKPKNRTHQQVENQIFVNNLSKRVMTASETLGKQMRLKVLIIYLLIQIAKKPLKGYFQLIMLKKQKINTKLQLQLSDLVSISRQCFDQIFFKNKVQNQQLNLLKIIFHEENIKGLEDDLKGILIESSHFLEIFRYNRLKIDQVQTEADKLVAKKAEIENKIQSLITDCYDNPALNFYMFVFYRFLQPYRSRQVQFKKTAGQQSLKKRLLLKAEGELITPDSGIIYIDLVEDRGRIKKITKNLCPAFGYAKEDMIGFNINLFMPTIFGKNHAKFLSNFIDKGRIKLLKQKQRVIFAKNKKKFIFPVNVRLKAQHLLDNQFGASALVNGVDTNSDFILVGKQGRIEQMTENIFLRTFKKSFRDDIHKLSKICVFKLIPGLNQIVEADDQRVSKIHEGLFIYSDQEDYLLEKFRYTRDNTYSSALGSKGGKSSTLSLLSSSTMTNATFNTKSQRFEFFSELFKTFLCDINPKRLKAFRISYKYSRIKTSQFEVQLIELVTCKQQLVGKQFLQELLSELNNVGEIFQLLEEQSAISQHLMKLEEQLQAQVSLKQNSLGLDTKMDRPNFYLERELDQNETQKHIRNQTEEQFIEDEMEEKQPLNCQNSQTSSVTGNNQSESKKQLLINAFNSSEDAIPLLAKVCTIIAVITLLTLLITMTLVELQSISKVESLWIDSSYILSLRLAYQFRLSLAELTRFGSNLNFTLPPQLVLQQQQLNNNMIELCRLISANTFNSQLQNSPYNFYTPIYDPNRNVLYNSTFAQSIMKLTQLFTEESSYNKETVRYNYETIHYNFTDFYNLRQTYYQDQSQSLQTLMTALLAAYEVLIGLVALSSIPMYIYFKRQQIAVRSKLAFMNQRQIRKSINRINTALQFFKAPITKATPSRLQYQLIQQRYDQEQQNSGSKIIKITSESQDYKMFKKPQTYCFLILFILFFSNLSIGLYSIFQSSNQTFIDAVRAHEIANDLETKTPFIVNIYISNLNRILQGRTTWNFMPNTYSDTAKRYYQLIQEVSDPKYETNKIAQYLKKGITTPICQTIQCLNQTDLSLQDIAQSFKDRFDYWNPSNSITPNLTTITSWVTQNSILNILDQVGYVLLLSTLGEKAIDEIFREEQDRLWKLALLLSGFLIPLNLICLTLILRKYLMQVNQMVKSAQQLYMNFPVQVLVENTYLTSYFTAKIKEGK